MEILLDIQQLQYLLVLSVFNMQILICWTTILVSSIAVSSGIIIRDYNEVHYKDYTSYDEFSSDHLTRVIGGGDLVTTGNLVIGVYEPQVC